MDRIVLRGLEIYAYHGVAEAERTLGQRFIIDIEIFADLELAAVNDDLQATIDYAAVCRDVQAVFTARKYWLLEAAAHAVATAILDGHPAAAEVLVRVQKHSVPIPFAVTSAAVEIRRRR